MIFPLAHLKSAGFIFLAAMLLAPAALLAADITEVIPLVRVNEDTLTTEDLKVELAIMERALKDKGSVVPIQAEAVLRRLTQNMLIVQEGYRLDLQDDFQVRNEIRSTVNQRSMEAMLDSVALSIPKDQPDFMAKREAAVIAFADGLYSQYEVVVDSTLLQSLDYGSADPQVQKRLRESDEILATVPTGNLRVQSFSRVLAFEEFHGLVGKDDAAETRDRRFKEWLDEVLIRFEAEKRGFTSEKRMVDMAKWLERDLIREKTLAILLDVEFEPSQEEIETYYQANQSLFMDTPRIKMKSAKFGTQEQADAFRAKVLAGGDLDWLKKSDPNVFEGAAPFPYEWYDPAKLDISQEVAVVGYCPEPYGVPGGWVVAIVSEREADSVQPLDKCLGSVMNKMKVRFMREYVAELMRRLEEVSSIEVFPGAESIVERLLAEATAEQK